MSKVDWTKWSAIAEVLSGTAVVITLFILILGVRENTDVTRASMYDRSIDSMNEFRALIVSDPEVAKIWQAFLDDEADSLDGIDSTRVSALVLLLFGIYEKAYFAHEYGVMGDSEWERFQFQICRQFGRVQASDAMTSSLERTMTPEFVLFAAQQCGN